MWLGHGSELPEAADFEVGPADLPGQDGTLLQVAFSILLRQGPRFNRPQIHQRRCSQVLLSAMSTSAAAKFDRVRLKREEVLNGLINEDKRAA